MAKEVSKMSVAELEQLLAAKREDEKNVKQRQRAAYEELRAKTVMDIRERVTHAVEVVRGLFDFVQTETDGFKDVMAEYGQLRFENQQSFTLQEGDFKVEVKSNKVKKFDERADMAATRLIEFLNAWMKRSERGVDDAMYQLAMTLLERNKMGELDYKSISKLYELEERFGDAEYSAIMQLFKESNIVNGTATNYYFSQRCKNGVWVKVEPSFNRM